jgi:hypothetical protein
VPLGLTVRACVALLLPDTQKVALPVKVGLALAQAEGEPLTEGEAE